MMEFSFVPSFKDQYLATLTIQFRSPLLLIMNLIFPSAGIFILYLILIKHHRLPSAYDIFIIFLAFGFTPIISIISVFFARRKNRTVKGTQRYIFDDTGINMSGADFNIHLNWSALYRISETSRYFLFFITPHAAYFMPKSILIDPFDFDEFRKLLLQFTACKIKLYKQSPSKAN
jgi:hypothetical protein